MSIFKRFCAFVTLVLLALSCTANSTAPVVPASPKVIAYTPPQMCLETGRHFCNAAHRCIGIAPDRCLEHFQACRLIQSVRDADELVNKCWPWWDGADCTTVSPDSMPSFCRDQFRQDQPGPIT